MRLLHAGFIVAAKALLDHNPNPTEEETRYWLAGNLCRCTGYDKIIRAVLDAAEVMRGAAAGRRLGEEKAGLEEEIESSSSSCRRKPVSMGVRPSPG